MWRVWVGFNISHGVGRCFSPVVFSTGDGAALRWQRLGAYQEPQRHYHRLQRLAESPALLAEAIKGGQSGKRGYLHRRSPGFYPGYEVSRSAGLVGDRARSRPCLGNTGFRHFLAPHPWGRRRAAAFPTFMWRAPRGECSRQGCPGKHGQKLAPRSDLLRYGDNSGLAYKHRLYGAGVTQRRIR